MCQGQCDGFENPCHLQRQPSFLDSENVTPGNLLFILVIHFLMLKQDSWVESDVNFGVRLIFGLRLGLPFTDCVTSSLALYVSQQHAVYH